MKYHIYKRVRVANDAGFDALEVELTKLSKQGWELVLVSDVWEGRAATLRMEQVDEDPPVQITTDSKTRKSQR